MTSYFDCSDAEGQDLGDDVECIHGVDLFARCVECKSLAANSGEGDDMQDIDKMMGNQNAGYETTFDVRLRELLSDANTLQLRQVRYSLEREEKKRLEDAQATIRALDPNAPKPRATRRDKGTTRAPKEHAA